MSINSITFRYSDNYKGVKFTELNDVSFLKIPIEQIKNIKRLFDLFSLDNKEIGTYILYNYENKPEIYIGEGIPINRLKKYVEIFDLKILKEKLTKEKIETTYKKNEIFYCEGKNSKAKGYFSEGGIIVLEGSIFSKQNVDSFKKHSYYKIKQELIETEILIPDPESGNYKLTENHFFKSPSSSSAIILGRTSMLERLEK